MRKSLFSILVLAAVSCFASPVFAVEAFHLNHGDIFLMGESGLPDVSRDTAVLHDRAGTSQLDHGSQMNVPRQSPISLSLGGATGKIGDETSRVLAGYDDGTHRDITHSEHLS